MPFLLRERLANSHPPSVRLHLIYRYKTQPQTQPPSRVSSRHESNVENPDTHNRLLGEISQESGFTIYPKNVCKECVIPRKIK